LAAHASACGIYGFSGAKPRMWKPLLDNAYQKPIQKEQAQGRKMGTCAERSALRHVIGGKWLTRECISQPGA
jgi:hypothetical protein